MPVEYSTTYQTGSGLSDIGRIYKGPVFVQRGRGIGSIFAGLWKHIAPIAVSGLKTLGKQSLKTGGHVLNDLSKGKKLKNVLTDRGRQAAADLTQKGINKLSRMGQPQQYQSGKGLLTHTTLGAIKAGNSQRNMLVGHVKRRRAKQRSRKTKTIRTAAGILKKKRRSVGRRRVRQRRQRTQIAGGRKKRRTNSISTQTAGGKRKRKRRTGGVTVSKKKRPRSIDIFDI